MKKIALTSLLAVFAASGAHAAAHISNPLYRPDAGMFYSHTAIETKNDESNVFTLGEGFGYGITDKLSVEVGVSLAEESWFDQAEWQGAGIGISYRALDYNEWKGDVYGSYSVSPVWGAGHGFLKGHFLEEDDTVYNWTVGARAGVVGHGWTVAGHAEFAYGNTESFNWNKVAHVDINDKGELVNLELQHTLSLGVDGQLYLNHNWSLVAGVEYTGFLKHDLWAANIGYWTGTFGVNYDLCDNSYVGAYFTKIMTHPMEINDEGLNSDHHAWEIQEGFALGMKFGIQF